MLKKGVCWRVGIGEDILLSNLWLSSRDQPRLQFPLSEELSTAHVVDLIDQLTKQWDLTQLDNLFLPHEVSSILSIHLCRNRIQDTFFWPFNQLGQYSVKSGYTFLVEEFMDLDQRESSSGKVEWKKIWGLTVQGKVNNLLWPACKDSIPSKQNLLRRKVILEDVCGPCHQSSEDTLHALWSCPCLSPI